jgi:hypothetical protein
MRLTAKNGWRVAGLLLVAFLVIVPGSSLVDASRNSADCVKACNAVRAQCQEQCVVDCAALFPPGQERNSCEGACSAVCIDESQVCKVKCNVVKNPPSPTEP